MKNDDGPKNSEKFVRGHQERFEESYRAREASIDRVYSQTLKIVQELLSRLEREMFRGMQYKAEKDKNMSLHDPGLCRSATGLGKLVTSLQNNHLRLIKEGERITKKMSQEEKIRSAARFVKKLPDSLKRQFILEAGLDV
jgi:hypothetical protein